MQADFAKKSESAPDCIYTRQKYARESRQPLSEKLSVRAHNFTESKEHQRHSQKETAHDIKARKYKEREQKSKSSTSRSVGEATHGTYQNQCPQKLWKLLDQGRRH